MRPADGRRRGGLLPIALVVAAACPQLSAQEGASPAEVLFWESIIHWETMRGTAEAAMYRAYLQRYPGGAFASLARLRLERVAEASAVPASPAPTAASLTAGEASLTVHAVVPGVRIFIDHRYVGTSNSLTLTLPPGAHWVRVERTGYGALSREIDLRPGERLTLRLDLPRSRAEAG